MKNTKKNTGTNPDISMHTQIISERITQKINEIGRKTHALKKRRTPIMPKRWKNHAAAENFWARTSCET